MELDYEKILVRFYYKGIRTNYLISPCNKGVFSLNTGKYLTPIIGEDGYVFYQLSINGKKFYTGYHRLVALTFLAIPDNPDDMDVDHLDSNPQNNHWTNLEWVTHAENNKRSFARGNHKPRCGEINSAALYSNAKVIEALELLQQGVVASDVSNLTNLPMSYIYGLISGKNRPDLVKHYNIPSSVLKRPIGKKASSEEIAKVWELKREGCSMKEVSEKTNIPVNKVKLIWYYKNIA